MSFDGSAMFPWGDAVSLECGFVYADGEAVSSRSYPRRDTAATADGLSIRFSGAPGLPELVLVARRAGDAREFTLTLSPAALPDAAARSIRYLRVLDIDLAVFLAPRRELWALRHGTASPGDPDICVPLAPGAAAGDSRFQRCYRVDGIAETYTGESLLLPRNLSTGRGGLFGFVTLHRQAARVMLRAESDSLRLGAFSDAWEWTSAAGAVTSETLRFEAGPDDNPLLDRWVARIAQLAPAKPLVPDRALIGWSDWQYYRRDVTQQHVLENVAAIRAERLPFEYIVVDDGFQANMSDWLVPNDRWPDGIADVGRRIAEAGMKPGVWLAPLTASEHSDFSRQRRDWLLRKPSGEVNWHDSHMGAVCAVDYTISDACEWLDRLVRTFVDEYGFKWIKLDGPIMRYYEGGRFAQPGVTQVEVVRRALEVIRRAAGASIVEGEGYYGPSIGLVDVQRVTQDIQTEWSRLRLCLQSNCLSGHFHRRLWVNNPETFLLRDVISPHYDAEVLLPSASLELEITVLALSGGVVQIADPISVLSGERKALIPAFLPPYPHAARPARLFDGGPCPSVMALDVKRSFGSWRVLAACNWQDCERDITVTLPAGSSHIFDFWRREYLGVHEGPMTLDVAGHGVRLLSARPFMGQEIELVGTGVHVTQGGVEIESLEAGQGGAALEMVLHAHYGGELVVYVRADSAPRVDARDTKGASSPRNAGVAPVGKGVYAINIAGDGRSRVTLTL